MLFPKNIFRVALLLCALPSLTSAATTVISETFSGSGNLPGQSADVGGTWSGSNNFQKNGSVLGGGTAYIPFTPAAGNIYYLSADLAPTAGVTSDWLAFGFTDSATSGANPMPFGGGTARGWMLLRDNGDIQAFLGADTANNVVGSYPAGNPSNLRVRLDTSNAANYTVQYYDETTALTAPGPIGAPGITQAAISSAAMTGSFDNFLLTQEAVVFNSGLLLSDNFTVNPPGTPNTSDLNFNLAARQTGALAQTSWRATGNTQIGNTGAGDKTILDGGNVLLGAGGAISTLNRNWNGAVSQKGLEILYDAAPDVAAGSINSANWVAINVGSDPQDTPGVNSGLTHFGLLVRENGQFQAFDGAAAVGAGPFTGTVLEDQFYTNIRLLLTDPTDGNPFDGVGVTKIEAFYQSAIPFFTFTKTGGGYANNYINFQSTNIGYVDNLRISAIPEPATLSLLLIGLCGLARFRRR